MVFDGAVCGAPFLVWRHCLGETAGVCPMCPVPNVGASPSSPGSLERTVYPQVEPLDPVDRSSKNFYHCTLFPWALVSVSALVSG